jgi:hypothetical protein
MVCGGLKGSGQRLKNRPFMGTRFSSASPWRWKNWKSTELTWIDCEERSGRLRLSRGSWRGCDTLAEDWAWRFIDRSRFWLWPCLNAGCPIMCIGALLTSSWVFSSLSFSGTTCWSRRDLTYGLSLDGFTSILCDWTKDDHARTTSLTTKSAAWALGECSWRLDRCCRVEGLLSTCEHW